MISVLMEINNINSVLMKWRIKNKNKIKIFEKLVTK
jgi:hypothetical protein